MNAHTTAPWVLEEFAADEVSLITADGLVVAQVIHGFDDEGEPDAETRANARLITAAPELLAALQRLQCVPMRRPQGDDDRLEFDSAFEAARAAIAKAVQS